MSEHSTPRRRDIDACRQKHVVSTSHCALLREVEACFRDIFARLSLEYLEMTKRRRGNQRLEDRIQSVELCIAADEVRELLSLSHEELTCDIMPQVHTTVHQETLKLLDTMLRAVKSTSSDEKLCAGFICDANMLFEAILEEVRESVRDAQGVVEEFFRGAQIRFFEDLIELAEVSDALARAQRQWPAISALLEEIRSDTDAADFQVSYSTSDLLQQMSIEQVVTYINSEDSLQSRKRRKRRKAKKRSVYFCDLSKMSESEFSAMAVAFQERLEHYEITQCRGTPRDMGVCCQRSQQPVLATCVKDPNTSTSTLLMFPRTADLHIFVQDESKRVITDEKLHLNLTEPIVAFSQINLFGKQKVWASGIYYLGCILPGMDVRGRHKVCQDMLFLETFQGLVLAGVMDGHGPKGDGVVAFCKRFVVDYFHTKITIAESNPEKFLTEMTEDCDKRLKMLGSGVDCLASGTTAVFLLYCNNWLYFSSVGDSRGILATTHPPDVLAATQPPRGDDKALLADIKRRRSVSPDIELIAVQMTKDQKPEDPQELARITSCGGVVMRLEDDNGKRVGPYRVWKVENMYPGIAMSRSLGDKLAHDIGVISSPIVNSRELKDGEDFFLVLASDGLWDMMENQEVCDFVEAYRLKSVRSLQVPKYSEVVDPFNTCIAHLLCEEARARWLCIVEAEDVNIDDISCIVLELQIHLPSKKRAPPRLVEPHKDITDVPGLEKGVRRAGTHFQDPLRQPSLKAEDVVKEDLETQAAVQIRDPRRSSVSDLLGVNRIS